PVIEHLETIELSRNTTARQVAFRFPVQLVLRPGLGYRGLAGQIASGRISVGDEVLVLPSQKRTRVVEIHNAGRPEPSASAPDSIALRLADELDVGRGDMLVKPDALPHVGSEFLADLVWMNERPLNPSKTYLLKHTTRTIRATLRMVHRTDPETLAP